MQEFAVINMCGTSNMELAFFEGIFNMLGGYATMCGVSRERLYDGWHPNDHALLPVGIFSFQHVYVSGRVFVDNAHIHVVQNRRWDGNSMFSVPIDAPDLLETARDMLIYIYNVGLRDVLYKGASCPNQKTTKYWKSMQDNLELTYLDLKDCKWLQGISSAFGFGSTDDLNGIVKASNEEEARKKCRNRRGPKRADEPIVKERAPRHCNDFRTATMKDQNDITRIIHIK